MRSPTRARLTFAALACSAALALAGCGGAPDAPPLAGNTATTSASTSPSPSASPTSTATSDPTPSPTPSPSRSASAPPPVGPDAAAIRSLAAAFLAADNSATRTGNYASRDKLTTNSCAWCTQKKAYVTKIYDGGGKITGELFTKNSVSVSGPVSGRYFATIKTTVSKYKEVDGNGKTIDAKGDRRGVLTLTAARSGGSWKVVGGLWQAT